MAHTKTLIDTSKLHVTATSNFTKDDKQKMYIAIGAAVVAIGAGVAAYQFWYKPKKAREAAAGQDSDSRTHSAHHDRQAKAGKHESKQQKKNVDSALASIDFARATKLSKEQIAALWEKFDADKSGALDGAEVRLLVKEVLGQIAQEKTVLTKYMQSMFDENTEAAQKQEIHGRLKHLHGELYHRSEGVAKQLMNRLDTNKDGKVTKEEFVQAFAQWLEQYHEREIRDYLQPEGLPVPRTPAEKVTHNSSVVH